MEKREKTPSFHVAPSFVISFYRNKYTKTGASEEEGMMDFSCLITSQVGAERGGDFDPF